jgi:DNA-binding LacI/PurR family transcriptional regulator
VAQPVRELGRQAAAALVDQLHRGEPAPYDVRPTVLPTRLVVRGSTGPPRA